MTRTKHSICERIKRGFDDRIETRGGRQLRGDEARLPTCSRHLTSAFVARHLRSAPLPEVPLAVEGPTPLKGSIDSKPEFGISELRSLQEGGPAVTAVDLGLHTIVIR
jgi:hypothetical protein